MEQHQENRMAAATSPGLNTLGGKQPRRWSEKLGDTLFEFVGDPASTATRKVVGIHSLIPLVKRQKAARIPPTYHGALLATWDEEKANPGVSEIVQGYIQHPGRSLYLYGSVGVGKTWAACTIANEILQHGASVYFQTVSELLLAIRDTFASEGGSELGVLAPLFEVDFLILDELGDLGLERERHASEFAASRILVLLDRRWREGKATVMTSNLSLGELVRWCGEERIGSRIRGVCGGHGIVELSGRDLRFDEIPEEIRA